MMKYVFIFKMVYNLLNLMIIVTLHLAAEM